MENEKKCHNKCHNVVGYQSAEINAPITVKPFAHLISTKTRCLGAPKVKTENCHCDKDGVCRFKIQQKLCVEVSVEFGADAKMDEPIIDCFKASEAEPLFHENEHLDCDKSDTCKNVSGFFH